MSSQQLPTQAQPDGSRSSRCFTGGSRVWCAAGRLYKADSGAVAEISER